MNKRKIIKLLRKVRRKGIRKLITYLQEKDYFSAPASTRFHASHVGGLAEHSWSVYKLFRKKNKEFNLNLPEETVIICSLLHDLCKVGVYSERTLKNGEPSKIPYELNEDLPLGHCTKSIFLIRRFIELTEEEALIIRWHMSWSDYEFKKHIEAVKKFAPAIIAFICADLEASTYLK